MAAELAALQRELEAERALNRNLVTMVRDLRDELARPLSPPPEILQSMTVRCGRMHAITMTAGNRDLVVVAPPEGFEDPEQAWRDINANYGSGN